MNDMDILETIDQHQLGNELKQARQKRGFTQADAAEILGVAKKNGPNKNKIQARNITVEN